MATAAEYPRTGARTANLPGRRFDHVFFTSMALIMLATVFAGCAHLLSCRTLPRAAAQPNHSDTWRGVYLLDSLARHSNFTGFRPASRYSSPLGCGGIFLGCLTLVLGVVAATDALARNASAGRDPRMFYIFHLSDMLVFGVLVYFAFRARRDPPAHRRFIYIATIALLGPAIARLPVALVYPSSPVVTWLTEGFLLLLVAYDLWSTHRIHRATLWAGAFLVLVLETRVPIGKTEAWHSFAASVQHLAR